MSSFAGAAAGGGGGGADLEDEEAGGDDGGEFALNPSGIALDPSGREKASMSIPIRTPITCIIRGSCKALWPMLDEEIDNY